MLTVIQLPSDNPDSSHRLSKTLSIALGNTEHKIYSELSPNPQGSTILFGLGLGEDGQNFAYYHLLAKLRTTPNLLTGCTVGIVIDGQGDLYTKSVATTFALALNLSGATLVGSPMVEGIGNLQNFDILSKQWKISLEESYVQAVKQLINRLLHPIFAPKTSSNILMLHASSRETSNTLDLWHGVKSHLPNQITTTEIGLRNGTVSDCCGCSYTTCLHFGEGGGCFYGGVICEEVVPAIKQADGLMLICPNYNDALSANLTAFINRLTALFRQAPFSDTALFAIIVSGYSGGEMLATQLISALNMNKSFYLPPNFAMIERANLPNEAVALPQIQSRIEGFATRIQHTLLK